MTISIKEIQELLIANGYDIVIDGIEGQQTTKAILNFQIKNKLYADGIVGPLTLEKLKASKTFLFPVIQKLKVVSVNCDKYKDGYGRITLREDAATAMQSIIDEAQKYGAIISSSGGKRELNSGVNSNRSATSLHYVCLANDLYIYGAMQDPKIDPYVCVKKTTESKDGWNVYARADKEKGAQKIKLLAYTKNHKEVEIEDCFVNLTEIFERNGYKGIKPRAGFFLSNNFLSSEWWHFQYEKALTPQKSTFGEELLKIYDIKTLEKYSLWQYKDFIWKKNWF